MSDLKLIPNPYIVGNPIKSEKMFFGREDDFEFIRRKLEDGNKSYIIVLCGERRSGKTSILFQILNGRLGSDFIPIFVDMQTMAGLKNEAEFFEKIAQEIFESLPENNLKAEKFELAGPQDNPYNVFDNLLNKIHSRFPSKSLLFLIDEYELIESKIRDGNLSVNFIRYLAGVLESNRKISFILAGSKRLDERKSDYWSILFGKSIYRNISFLSRQDTLRLVVEPAREFVTYNENVLDTIYRLTVGQPFYTQVICQNIIELLNEKKETYVDSSTLDNVVNEILDHPLPQMVYSWNKMSNDQKLILSLLADGLEDAEDALHPDFIRKTTRKHETEFDLHISIQTIRSTLESLYHQKIVRKTEGLYAFQIDLFRLWIKREHSIWRIMKEIGSKSPAPEPVEEEKTILMLDLDQESFKAEIKPEKKLRVNKWIITAGIILLFAVGLYIFIPPSVQNASQTSKDLSVNESNENLSSTGTLKDSVTQDEEISAPGPPKPDPEEELRRETRETQKQMATASRSKMNQAKDAARKARAENTGVFIEALEKENIAEKKLVSGDYPGATASFDKATTLYNQANDIAVQLEAQKNEAILALEELDNAKSGAEAVSAGSKAKSTWDEAKQEEEKARQLFEQQRFQEAAAGFKKAANIYLLSAEQAKEASDRRLAEILSLQNKIQNLKLNLNAEYQPLNEYQQASAAENKAITQLRGGNLDGAIQNYEQAINLYTAASEKREKQREEILSTLRQYEHALEDKNLNFLKRLYVSLPKESEDNWKRTFKNVSNIQVDIEMQRITFIDKRQAEAAINIRLIFSGAQGSGESNQWIMKLIESDAGWRISDINENR